MTSSSSPIPNSASGSNNSNSSNNNNNNNNSNQFRDERVIFLKELARNADIDIYDLANQLSLSQESVMAYVRSFFKTVAEFANSDDQLDRSGYANVKQVINSNVSTEHGGLTDNHIQNLMYVYEKYRKLQPDLYIEADGVKASKSFSSLPKQVLPKPQPQPNPQQPQMIAHSNNLPRSDNVDEEFKHVGPQDFNVDRLNKPHNYEFLGKLSRKGLVQWVLEGVPIPISTPKIENYIQYFEVNQDEIFTSPHALRASLIDWFGDKTGDNAAKLIYSYLKFLPSDEGFGQQKLSGGKFKEGYWSGDNPLYQKPGIAHYPQGNPFAPNDGYQGNGPRMEDPFNTYWHAQGILPFGMNIYSVDAKRLIAEAEQKRREKEKQKEEQQEMMDMMRNKMSMSYAEMFDAKKFGFGGGGGGGGNGQLGGGNQIFTPDFLQGLVATTAITGIAQGKMQALPTQNPETGKMEVKLVPVSDNAAAMAAAAAANANAPPELGLKDMLELVKTMYDSVDRKRDEAMSFKIDTLKEVYGNKENKDPIQQVGDTFKALKEIVPGLDMKFQGGNGHDIELHRLLLEKDKFMYDREKTDKLIDHQLGMKEKKEEFEHENELAANKSRNTSLKMITNILTSNLPMFINLIMTFLSMKNPKFAPFASMMGGGGGGLGGGAGQSAGGGGMGGMGGIGDFVSNLLKGVSGGTGEDEDEDEDDSFMGAKKKRERRQMDEDEDEIAEGGFNLGGLEGMVGQAVDLLKSAGMPGLNNPMAGADVNEEEGGGVVIPETRHNPRQQHSSRHVHNRRGGGGGAGGTRPTFRNVSIGNPNAAVVQMPVPGTEAVNAYDDIEIQTRKRIATTPHPTSPTIEDIMRNSVVVGGEGSGEGPGQEYTNAYGDRIPGDMINEPQVIIPETVSTAATVQEQEQEQEEGGGEGDETKEYPEYSANDFKDWTVEQLHNAKKDGYDAARSHESYLKSVEEVLREKERES